MERAIEATTTVEATPACCRSALLADPGRMMASVAYPGMVVEIGDPVDADGAWRLPLSWHASSFERLIPMFEGELELVPDGQHSLLRLSGHYAVPLGAMGRFGDGLVGRRVARRTAAGVVEAIAGCIEREVGMPLPATDADPVARVPAHHATIVQDRESV